MNLFKYFCLFALFTSAVACQDLDDTYSEYSGDGTIKYPGKCTNIELESAWHKINVHWTDAVDNNLSKVKVAWSYALNGSIIKDSAIIAKGIETYTIDSITTAENLEVVVHSIGVNNTLSLPTTLYGRAYTEAHEEIISFSRIVNNNYAIDNKIIIVFEPWSNKIKEATLTYTLLGGGETVIPVDSILVTNNHIYIVNNVNTSKDVTINRTGNVGGSVSGGLTDGVEVVFDPLVLDFNPSYSSDFLSLFAEQYGVTSHEDIQSVADTLTVLNIEKSITSLIDIFNLPKLEKINFGAHRYMSGSYFDSQSYIVVSESEESKDVLTKFNDNISSISVTAYYEHVQELRDYAGINIVAMPTFTYSNQYPFTADDITVNYEFEDYASYNPINLYLTPSYNAFRVDADKSDDYVFVFDLGSPQPISTFVLKQIEYNQPTYFPELVKIEYSDDNATWKDAINYSEYIPLYTAVGETNVINLASTVNAQYVKFTLPLNSLSNNYGVGLSFFHILP